MTERLLATVLMGGLTFPAGSLHFLLFCVFHIPALYLGSFPVNAPDQNARAEQTKKKLEVLRTLSEQQGVAGFEDMFLQLSNSLYNMWQGERGAGGDGQYEMGVTSEITYVNDPPERDIGPNTSRNVIIRDLRQMANDYGSTNIGLEMSKMKKLENIYSITANATLQNLGGFKEQVKEKKMMLDELLITNTNLKAQQKKKGQLAITDGSGIDILEGVNDHNIDQKLKQMEKRIIEAKRAAELRGSEFGIQEALSNYHDVFKQSMESMENIAKSRSNRTLPRMSSFRQFIDDTENKLSPGGKGDEQVTKALKELKHLNKYNTFDPNKLPFIPELPHDYEEELAHLNIMYNDVLEDLNVKEDMVELPMTEFLEHTPKLKPAKSIMKKIEDAGRKKGTNVKSRKMSGKVKFQHEQKTK